MHGDSSVHEDSTARSSWWTPLVGPLPIAALILAIGLIITHGLWQNAKEGLEREARAHVETASSMTLAAIARRMQEYQTTIVGLQGLFAASTGVSRGEFRSYYRNLTAQVPMPGLRALHFTRSVSAGEKSAFVAAVRGDRSADEGGYPDFAIHPDTPRDEYFVIEYIEPLEHNRAAFGLDAASQPANQTSFLAARDSGKIGLSPPFHLMQLGPDQRGLVMRAPVYRSGTRLDTIEERRSAFIGLVGVSLDAEAIFSDIFAEPFAAGLQIVITDVMAAPGQTPPVPLRQLVAANIAQAASPTPQAVDFSTVTIMPVGQRLWEVSVWPSDAWLASRLGDSATRLMLSAGAAISVLLAMLYLALARSRIHAQKLAERMTDNLRRSEQQSRQTATILQATLDNMGQGISVVDAELRMTALNRRFCELLDIPEQMAMHGSHFADLARFNAERGEYGPCDVEEKVREMVAMARLPQPHRFRRRRPNGRIVEVVGNPLPVGGFVTTYTDVTEQEIAEQTIRESEALFRNVFQTTPIAASISVFADGRYRVVNDAYSRIFGYTREELLGSDSLAIGLWPDKEARQGFLAKFLSSDTVSDYQAQLFDRERRSHDALLFASRIEYAGEMCVLTMLYDITDRVRSEHALRASEARFMSLFEKSPVALSVTQEKDGFVSTRWNETWFSRFGYPTEVAQGKDGNQIGLWVDPTLRERYIERARTHGEVTHLIAEVRRYDGANCWVSVSGRFIESDGQRMLITLYDDITDRKAAEEELRRYREHLEELVSTRTSQLMQAKEAAESANRAKSDFLASMSHELRTPLNAVIGFAQLLEIESNLTPDDKDSVAQIKHAGRHLLSLISDILDLTVIESGQLIVDIRPVAVREAVSDALSLIAPLASTHGVQVVFETDGAMTDAVRADTLRLRQILVNLLTNAIKYNRPGGSVRVICRRAGDKHRISIVDTGQGIPADMQSRVFSAFDRLGKEGIEAEGTGIGLTICKRLVEVMAGRIGFESVAGEGSTFWFELPLGEMDKPHAVESSTHAAQFATTDERMNRFVVLYIEDNPASLRLMRAIFAKENRLELIEAPTAETGLELARKVPPDLVLMDIQLPGMSGFDALAALKADPITRNIPVIALSANAMTESIQRGLESGFAEYLTKPVDVASMLAILDRFIASAGPPKSAP